MADLMDILLEQEKALQFVKFDSQTAWRIGSQLVAIARTRGLGIVVDINRCGQQLFHWAADGTTVDNDRWVERKARTVARFGHSSYYMGRRLAAQGVTAAAKYFVSEGEYCFHGGAFPIILKGTGVIGSVVVSGLKQEDDHDLVVQALCAVLRKPEGAVPRFI
jgi:uncharacterized protein (UPF0303 family)